MREEIEERIRTLEEKGVVIIDPRQTYIGPEVDLDRIYSGSVLYPGSRLTGPRTLVGSRAQIGTEGPGVIHNSIIGAHGEVGSGFLSDATGQGGSQLSLPGGNTSGGICFHGPLRGPEAIHIDVQCHIGLAD